MPTRVRTFAVALVVVALASACTSATSAPRADTGVDVSLAADVGFDADVADADASPPDADVDAASDVGPSDAGTGCLAAGDVCGDHAHCRNRIAGLTCMCDRGYHDLGSGCVDLDECTYQGRNGDCGDGVLCTNLEGTHRCGDCGPGQYVFPGTDFCIALDVCDNNEFLPACYWDYASCGRSAGGIVCSCPTGYGDDGFESCVDVDECSADVCDPNGSVLGERCENLPGSFACTCPGVGAPQAAPCAP